MGRPAEGYHLKDGTKVPGVTTILGRYKESGGLLWWANRLAYEPLGQAYALLRQVAQLAGDENAAHDGRSVSISVDLDWAIAAFLETPITAYDHTKTRDKAADAGTLTHAMVEAYLLGKDPHAPEIRGSHSTEILSKAETAFLGFLEWADTTHIEVEETELSLVSDVHRFGGTLDCCVLKVRGQRSIGDWKTSNGLYSDMLLQVAAYRALYIENRPQSGVDGGLHVFRFSKDTGDFHHHYFTELDDAWESFKLLRAAYEYDKALKKRAK